MARWGLNLYDVSLRAVAGKRESEQVKQEIVKDRIKRKKVKVNKFVEGESQSYDHPNGLPSGNKKLHLCDTTVSLRTVAKTYSG